MASISNPSLCSHPKILIRKQPQKQSLLFSPMASGHRGRSDQLRLKTLPFTAQREARGGVSTGSLRPSGLPLILL
ncbi:hypothetical protein SLA2020_108650 [Shorea laevis]